MEAMKRTTFKALVVAESEDKTFTRKIKERNLDELPPGDVLVRVRYSSLNYKDALSSSGNRGVTRQYPHTPGIDAAGIVEGSDSEAFQPGDRVIVTSYDLGMNTSGGFGQYIRVPAGWVVNLPRDLTLKESMIFGTAGFTAGLSVHELIQSVKPEDGEVLVTGATGGVGSVAVGILSKLGYPVVAVSGKPESKEFLFGLGARKVIGREEAGESSNRPLLKGRWAGVVDVVGGDILATAIKSANLGATVTCCGNVASPDLSLTVFPFILRGVKLVGIDSQHCPMEHRTAVWHKLASEWKIDQLGDLCREITMEQLSENLDLLLEGKSQGRIVLDLEK